MAWSKAKSTIAVAAVVLLGGGGTAIVTKEIVHAVRVAHYPDIQGAWEGVMLVDYYPGVVNGESAKTHVVIHLVKRYGVYSATADFIEMGRKNVPMAGVVYDYPSLQIQQTVRDVWNLKVNASARQMRWDHYIHFIQPDPVQLTRTTVPDKVPDPLMEEDFTPRHGSDLQGYWKGLLGAGPDAVPVDLKIAEEPDGTFQAEGDNPMEGADGEPLIVTYKRPMATFAVASGAGVFRGQVNDDDTEISGTWVQGGQSLPARIKRADYQAEHAQDAEKNYTYTSKDDLQGHWKGSWILTVSKSKATMRMALDIAKLPDGSYSATISSVDQFGFDAPIPASDFQFSSPNVHAEWKWAGAGYGGDVSPGYDGKLENGKLVGTWNQSGGSFKLVFERQN